MEPLNNTSSAPSTRTAKRPRSARVRVLTAFVLGAVAGAALMFCAGLLFLRGHLIVRTEFPGLTADDFDDVLENEFPEGNGWHAVRETVSLPMPGDGRTLYNWRLYHRNFERALMDDPDRGLLLTALIPATLSVTNDPKDGHAVISRLNPTVLGFVLGGEAGALLRSDIERDQAAILRTLADRSRNEKATRKEPEP